MLFLVHFLFLELDLVYRLLLFFISKPGHSFTLLPRSDAHLSLCVLELTYAVLHSLAPEAQILFAIRPAVHSEALLLVITVVAVIRPTIRPLVKPFAIELAFSVHAYVLSLICGSENAVATHLVLLPLTFVAGAIWPKVLAVAILEALLEGPLVNGVITQLFFAMTVLHIILPLAGVLLLLLVVIVLTITVCLVIFEIADVCVAVGVLECTIAVCFSVLYVAGVGGTVGPVQSATSVRNEHQLVLTVECCIFVMHFVSVATSCHNFHLAGVGCSIGMDLEVFFFNQMLLWHLFQRWITLFPLYYLFLLLHRISRRTVRLLLLHVLFLEDYVLFKCLLYGLRRHKLVLIFILAVL